MIMIKGSPLAVDTEEDNNIQIFINKKEMLYSHQNMARVINNFLPYLTNDDLTKLGQDIFDLMHLRAHTRQCIVCGCSVSRYEN